MSLKYSTMNPYYLDEVFQAFFFFSKQILCQIGLNDRSKIYLYVYIHSIFKYCICVCICFLTFLFFVRRKCFMKWWGWSKSPYKAVVSTSGAQALCPQGGQLGREDHKQAEHTETSWNPTPMNSNPICSVASDLSGGHVLQKLGLFLKNICFY